MLDDLGMTRQRRASRLQVINYSVTFLNSFYLHKQFSILLAVGVQLNTMVLVFPLIFSISEQEKKGLLHPTYIPILFQKDNLNHFLKV